MSGRIVHCVKFQKDLPGLDEAPWPGELGQRIRAAIEPFDVAGLTDRSRHSWYPALATDLCRAAPKLDASETEITTMLRKCGFNAPQS